LYCSGHSFTVSYPFDIMKIYSTREDWLTAAVAELRPMFDLWAAPLPKSIRVACGFPSTFKRSHAIGECWADVASTDKTFEILISPTIDDPGRVFDILIHELVHSLPGCMNHGVNFQKHATAMHLRAVGTGRQPWKSTVQASGFEVAYKAIINSLGEYPHAALNATAQRKVQGTRMLKASCPECGYTVRLTQKWAAVGMPHCPCGECMQLN